jgi:hypothetical protein
MIKRRWSQLAICGGKPAFARAVHVGRPNIGDRDRLLQRFNDILDRRTFSDELVKALRAENVLARRYFFPGCHRMMPNDSQYHQASDFLTNTEHVAERVMTLPTGTGVSEDDIDIISDLIRLMIEHGPAVHGQFSGRASI